MGSLCINVLVFCLKSVHVDHPRARDPSTFAVYDRGFSLVHPAVRDGVCLFLLSSCDTFNLFKLFMDRPGSFFAEVSFSPDDFDRSVSPSLS